MPDTKPTAAEKLLDSLVKITVTVEPKKSGKDVARKPRYFPKGAPKEGISFVDFKKSVLMLIKKYPYLRQFTNVSKAQEELIDKTKTRELIALRNKHR